MHKLRPYEENDLTRPLSLDVTAKKTAADALTLEFSLRGPLETLQFPEVLLVSERKDELWKATCLEAFLATSLQVPGYFEINCAPNGDWNAYSLTGYRAGMAPAAMQVRLVHREGDKQSMLFRIEVSGNDISSLHHLSATAVLQFRDGSVSYWAVTHAGTRPDFHLRDSFTISL